MDSFTELHLCTLPIQKKKFKFSFGQKLFFFFTKGLIFLFWKYLISKRCRYFFEHMPVLNLHINSGDYSLCNHWQVCDVKIRTSTPAAGLSNPFMLCSWFFRTKDDKDQQMHHTLRRVLDETSGKPLCRAA